MVGAYSYAHSARIVKCLLENFDLGIFHYSHHIIHGEIGKHKVYHPLLVALDYGSGGYRLAGSFAICHDKAACAELYAAEVTHHHYYDIGEVE